MKQLSINHISAASIRANVSLNTSTRIARCR